MGIPSYFSHIIHKHAKIVCTYANIIQQNIQFNRLYMDCNSILYDSYHSTDMSLPVEQFRNTIIVKTIAKIQLYIKQISPNSLVYIAFDGVAPMAKMEQQRTRRYKSWFETSMNRTIDPPKEPIDLEKTSCMFTPGTEFMKQLSIFVRKEFEKKEKEYGVRKIIVATPDEPGEGEHKLYAHIRENPCTEETSVIYGLDADLLMLSLLNLRFCPQMYVFREAPQFASLKMNHKHAADEPLFLDIAKMGRSIAQSMHCKAPDSHRLLDYVFICFFLGNDFLPHFPSMNIRTHGIQALLDVYRNTVGNKPEQFLLSKCTGSTTFPQIEWKTLSRFIQELAKHEHGWIIQEYAVRKKWDHKSVDLQPKKTVKEKLELFTNTPILYRATEKAIAPHESKWQTRYYELLFPENTSVLSICKSYLEGLEWVTQYYFHGKTHWNYYYPYHYPPLLEDLAPKVPQYPCGFLSKDSTTRPLHPYSQLSYVLPPIYHFLLPTELSTLLARQYSECYVGTINEDGLPTLHFQWSFCRYFWECHVELPTISSAVLQDIDRVSYKIDSININSR